MSGEREIEESVYDAHPNGWGEHPPAKHVPGQIVLGPTPPKTPLEKERSILLKLTKAGTERVRSTNKIEKTIFVAASLAALGGIIGVWGYEYHKKRHRKTK